MATCAPKKYVGRDVVMEYAIGCGDTLPLEGEWKRFGAMRTKSFSAPWDTVDATADDIIGYVRENLATYQSMTVSGDGTLLRGDGADAENLVQLNLHYFNPVATGGQPVAWFRLTFPDLTFTVFMIINDLSREAPNDEVATYSFEAMATASDFGLIVERTIDPDAPDVATVTATPSAATLEVGQKLQILAVVGPSGAPSGVTYVSSAPAIAIVNANGRVTAVAEGPATITVTSTDDNAKTDTVAITVS